MALIKGQKFRAQDDDPENGRNQENEEFTRRGSLIKGSETSRLVLDQASEQGFQKDPPRRGKILKGLTIQATEQQKAKETGLLGEAEFTPATFVPDGPIGAGIPRDVVMIPSKEPQNKPEIQITMSSPTDPEFTVTESAPVGESTGDSQSGAVNVNVEEIIAQAEEKAGEEAARIIETAQAEAKNLIDQAKVYGETARTEAKNEGFKEGREEGYKAGYDEFKSMMDEAKSLLSQISAERNKFIETVEPELAKLSTEIAAKILATEIKQDKDAVLKVVREATSKVKSSEQVTIKVNPEDLENVKENKNIFASLIEGVKELEITADSNVDKGGCFIETNIGNTDARIKTQLEVIKRAFENVQTGTM